ncbi:hypothetical protein SFMTTN_2064 [Sulfuriferula multivorans]|uniref:Uncharacterized protein n=1 Tax=Sulfuriferula multivorans TaxID=1559896 RepID=A0A401JF43_9PROT|nr:hypothetical protein [Sulfuriferula multivorans]GBL46251.1 hypothetical protein SFMTTN_2064 [Sulfuriferula multivorans]
MTWTKTAEKQPMPLHDVLIAHVCEIDDEPIVEIAFLSKTGQWRISNAAATPIAPPPFWQFKPALPLALQPMQQEAA